MMSVKNNHQKMRFAPCAVKRCREQRRSRAFSPSASRFGIGMGRGPGGEFPQRENSRIEPLNQSQSRASVFPGRGTRFSLSPGEKCQAEVRPGEGGRYSYSFPSGVHGGASYHHSRELPQSRTNHITQAQGAAQRHHRAGAEAGASLSVSSPWARNAAVRRCVFPGGSNRAVW